MHSQHGPGKKFLKKFTLVVCLFIFVVSSAGCQTMRKKFIRKKKKEKEQAQDFIPVLEPIDYAAKVYTPQEKYRHHYMLWKVWNDEILNTIAEVGGSRLGRGSDKKQKYLLGQLIKELQEMAQWVDASKQQELQAVVDAMNAVLARYEKPPELRNMFAISKDIEHSAKNVRIHLSPEALTAQKSYKD
ncbi:MAG: hypothetical protein Q7S13_00520 [Candidatus Omnitrophota bacterium]|nr:hypothetical protein [Candidatus Omnitrophota bacterium]